MCEKEERVSIRLDLEGENAEAFLLVKSRLGLKNNTEVIRQLIHEAANREKLREATRLEVKEVPVV